MTPHSTRSLTRTSARSSPDELDYDLKDVIQDAVSNGYGITSARLSTRLRGRPVTPNEHLPPPPISKRRWRVDDARP